MINVIKLSNELRAAGITTHGNCNSNGVVWDDDNNEIQDREDVLAILEAHDPAPDPEPKTADQKIAELQATIALLIKAADNTKLSETENAALTDAVAVMESEAELM